MIDTLALADSPAAAALSARFAWPHRPEDWQSFLRLGQGVAWREDGALAGTALWFPLDDAHASIGLVQVDPALQGRGIGRRLMQAVMDQAAPRHLLLHATMEGAGLYRSMGFDPMGTVDQWQGIATPRANGAEPAHGNAVAAIEALDQAATGLSRASILRLLQAEATVIQATPTGYAFSRRFGRGQHIGPVIAGTETEAIALVDTLATPGFLRLDLPAEATALAAHLARIGLSRVGQVQAMARGPWPVPPGPARRYGLASQAIG